VRPITKLKVNFVEKKEKQEQGLLKDGMTEEGITRVALLL